MRKLIKKDGSQSDVIVNAQYHPGRDEWSLLVVDRLNSGTHKGYNVLYNSVCNKEYFWSEDEALAFWEKVKQKMK